MDPISMSKRAEAENVEKHTKEVAEYYDINKDGYLDSEEGRKIVDWLLKNGYKMMTPQEHRTEGGYLISKYVGEIPDDARVTIYNVNLKRGKQNFGMLGVHFAIQQTGPFEFQIQIVEEPYQALLESAKAGQK
jgi:hypothetical protein